MKHNICREFLSAKKETIYETGKSYESLKVYSLENAMKKVMEFVAKNTVKILKSDEFLSAKKETIFDIAKMKNLTAKQEEVFEAICKWNEHNCPEETVKKNHFLKKQMEDIIPLIDFSSMDLNFLNNFVGKDFFCFPVVYANFFNSQMMFFLKNIEKSMKDFYLIKTTNKQYKKI